MPPLDLEPIPDPAYPDGWPIGSSEAAGTDYEAQELLHKPHAFALMHGDNGAKIAYGQLHWRVDSFTLKFMTDLIEVTVADHPYWDHTHPAHPAHTHEHDHYHTTRPHTHTIDEDSQTHSGHGSGGSYEDTHDHGGHTGSVVTETGSTQSPDDATTGDPSATLTHDTPRRPALAHTVGLPTITYCSQSAQEAMANMSTTTPKVKTKDGIAMDPQWGNTKYHELDEYGTVYLVWQVDIEQPGGEVIACWVQVGEPEDTTTVGNISEGTSTTNRRNTGSPHFGTGEPEDGDADVENDDKGIFYIELGSVAEGDHVTQLVSSDVNWTSTVMDREAVTAVNATPTGTFH